MTSIRALSGSARARKAASGRKGSQLSSWTVAVLPLASPAMATSSMTIGPATLAYPADFCPFGTPRAVRTRPGRVKTHAQASSPIIGTFPDKIVLTLAKERSGRQRASRSGSGSSAQLRGFVDVGRRLAAEEGQCQRQADDGFGRGEDQHH